MLFQVALVDLLKSMGIEPDGIVGHSVGELGCAYADGTFTSEQAILAAYWRGRSILESKLPVGAMAAIGKNLFSFPIRKKMVKYLSEHNALFRSVLGRDHSTKTR